MCIFKVNQLSTDYSAICTNISRGGLGFDCATRLELGAIIEFEFAYCGDHPYRHSARILYRIGKHYGAYSLDGDEDAWDDAQDADEVVPPTKNKVH